MPDVIIPVTAKTTTRKEVRATAAVATNNLDAPLDNPIAKYGFQIQRVLEPQDSDGNKTGLRESVPDLQVGMMDVLTRTFTRADGTTFSGAQHMQDHNTVIDHYKGQELAPPASIPQPQDPPVEEGN